MTLRIWSQHGPEVTRRLRAELTGVHIEHIDARHPDRPPGPVADVIFARPLVGLDQEALTAIDATWAAGVRWVHLGATGVDLFPPALLEGREAISSSGGASAPAIAEFAIAAMLAAEKRLPEIWDPDADRSRLSLGTLERRTVGVVGYGAIGRRVSELARAFGARVLATRRTAMRGTHAGTRFVPLLELLRRSDHTVIAVPATPQTTHLLDRRALSDARPGMHLINVARGSVIDHDALVDALRTGAVSRATLDVTEPEPLPTDHPLRTHPQVRISPHVAWMSDDAAKLAVDRFVDNVRRRRAGQPLTGLVDPVLGY